MQATLIEKPSFSSTDNTLKAGYTYFDPIAGSPMKLTLELGRDGENARLSAAVSRTGSGGDKAARFVVLYANASSAWAPARTPRSCTIARTTGASSRVTCSPVTGIR